MSVEAATAKAAVFFGPGKPFEIRDVPIPDVEPEGVLIRVTLANICGSDLHFSHTYPLAQINEAFAASEWLNRETTTITRAALSP